MQKKDLVRLIILALAVVALGAITFAIPTIKEIRKKAFFGSVNVRLDPATASKAVNEEFDVTIKIEAAALKISGIDLKIAFNKDQLRIVRFTPNSAAFPTDMTNNDPNLLGASTGNARLIAVNTTAGLPTGTFAAGIIRLKGMAASGTSPFTLTVNQTTSAVVGESATNDVSLSLDQITNGSYTIAGGPAATATATGAQVPLGVVTVRAVPNFPTVSGRVNTAFSSFLKLNAGSNLVKNVTLFIKYSPDKVEFTNVTPQNGFVAASGTGWSKASGVLTLNFKKDTGQSGDFDLVKLEMKVAANRPEGGTTYIYACQTGANCNINGGGNPYTLNIAAQEDDPNRIIRVGFQGFEAAATATPPPGATATPTPTLPVATNTPAVAATATPVPGSGPVLNFKIKFQGITQKRADQKVKVIVQKGDFTKAFSDINVIANDSGLYAGSVNLDGVTPGAGYTIFIKGPKHLSRRFCIDNQAERCPTNRNGTITLTAGQNNFDLSKINLLAGDLPNPADSWKQSGVVNSLDYSLFQARLLKDDVDSLKVADVDLSGQVNAGDWLIMRLTLETAYDEDQ